MAPKETSSNFGDQPAAELGEESEVETVARALIKDLELGEDAISSDQRDLSKFFTPFLALSDKIFAKIGLDLSVAIGISGDWNLALKFALRLANLSADRLEVKLWELRCKVECARYAEALAIVQNVPWEANQLIHVNYLTGLAYESLGMREQAHLRFESVRRHDPHYRDVPFKI